MIFSAGAWLAALVGLGTVLLWRGALRAGRILTTLGALGLILIAALPIDQWTLEPLENRFPPLPPGEKFDGIIVLGGFLEPALSADRDQPILNGAADRLTAFVAQARLHPEARLVFTGGPLPNRPDSPPEALGVRIELDRLGLPTERVTFEQVSRTTRENAVMSYALVQPKPSEHWMLITSAAHMPRSIGAFRAVGWPMLANPVGYRTYNAPSHRATRGFGERLALLDIAAHEWIGLVVYRFRKQTEELFPKP